MRPPPSPASDGTARRQRLALWVVALYATLSALWITLSDTLLSWWIPDTETLARASLLKGWAFVALTSVALYALLYRWSTASADGAPNGGPLAGVIPRWGVGLLIGTVLGVTGITLAQRYQQAQHHAAIHLGLMLQAKQAQLTDWHEERLNDARLLSQRRGLREGWDAWREAPDAPRPRRCGMPSSKRWSWAATAPRGSSTDRATPSGSVPSRPIRRVSSPRPPRVCSTPPRRRAPGSMQTVAGSGSSWPTYRAWPIQPRWCWPSTMSTSR
jgi:type II secretory pathway pseudopilin PulG